MENTYINNAIVLMVLLPMAAGIIGMVLRKAVAIQRWCVGLLLGVCAVCGTWLTWTLPAGGEWVSFLGNWPPPYSITIVHDQLSGTLMTIACVVGVASLLAGVGERGDIFQRRWLSPMLAMLILGVNFSFLTGDLFNLFVAFEIMLMASYALALRNADSRGVKQSHKYIVINLFASAMFVLGAGLVYGVTGTLNMADLAHYADLFAAAGVQPPAAFSAAGVILLFVFTTKAAIFPLWFWLPDTYHTMPLAVGGLFAALLSKVGMYAIVRVIVPTFGGLEGFPLSEILAVLAGLTMVVGALCALGVPTIRRVMSFVLIAHMGYALFMASLGTAGSLGTIGFLLAQEMFVIGGLYLVGSACVRATGTDDLRRIGGLFREMPALAWMAFVLTIAGAGLPPTAAFVAKAWIVKEGVTQGAWVLTSLMMVSAFLMLLALIRAWSATFWTLRSSAAGCSCREPSCRWLVSSVAVLVIGVVVTSVGSRELYGLMAQSGVRLMESGRDLREVYVAPSVSPRNSEQDGDMTGAANGGAQ